MMRKRIFTTLLALLVAGAMTVTALADTATPSVSAAASVTYAQRYSSFTADLRLHGTPGGAVPQALEMRIRCDNAEIETLVAGTLSNTKLTEDAGVVTLSYFGEESALFDENGQALLGTLTLKAGGSGSVTVTITDALGTVDGYTDVPVPVSGACSVAIYRPSYVTPDAPVDSPKTGDAGIVWYCVAGAAACAAVAGTRRRFHA